MTAPFRGPELAIDTTTIHRFVSIYDAAIDVEASPRDPDWDPKKSRSKTPPLLYQRTGDVADLVLRKVVGEDGQEFGPVWFYLRAIDEPELASIRAQIPDVPGQRGRWLLNELFRVCVVRVDGMRVPATRPDGKPLLSEAGHRVWRPVLFEKQSLVGRLDRMTDRFYRHFDGPLDKVRIEMGERALNLSQETREHLGNS